MVRTEALGEALALLSELGVTVTSGTIEVRRGRASVGVSLSMDVSLVPSLLLLAVEEVQNLRSTVLTGLRLLDLGDEMDDWPLLVEGLAVVSVLADANTLLLIEGEAATMLESEAGVLIVVIASDDVVFC